MRRSCLRLITGSGFAGYGGGSAYQQSATNDDSSDRQRQRTGRSSFCGSSSASPCSSDPFTVLGLTRGESYSSEEVKKAFKRRAMDVHPDKPGGNDEAFRNLSNAYEKVQRERGEGKPQQEGTQPQYTHSSTWEPSGDSGEWRRTSGPYSSDFYQHPHHRPWMHSTRTRVDEQGNYHTEGEDDAAFKRWKAEQGKYYGPNGNGLRDVAGDPPYRRIAWVCLKWVVAVTAVYYAIVHYRNLVADTKRRHSLDTYSEADIERISKLNTSKPSDQSLFARVVRESAPAYAPRSTAANPNGSDGGAINAQSYNEALMRKLHGSSPSMSQSSGSGTPEMVPQNASAKAADKYREAVPPVVGLMYQGRPFTPEGLQALRDERRRKKAGLPEPMEAPEDTAEDDASVD